MGRLIDADLLMENYDLKSATKYGNKSAKQQEHSYSTLMMYEIADMIEDAPTAYDVEAVVKQIEELPTKKTTKMVESKEVPEWFYEVVTGEYIKKNDVVEIVRNGGVSNVGL